MSAHVLLNLLNEGKKIRCEALPSILSVFPNKFNKFNNTRAQMQDSIYHMTLKSHFISKFCTKTSRFRHQKTRRFYGHQHIMLRRKLHIQSTSGLSFLMHGFITLSDAMSYDKSYYISCIKTVITITEMFINTITSDFVCQCCKGISCKF